MALANAKVLRRTLTEPEKKLWRGLREKLSMARTHFRRQVPLGPYIADFVCLAARVVIEVDGEHHGAEAQRLRDEERTKYLEQHGFKVLRFSNRDVMMETASVLETILSELAERESPACSSSKEMENT